MKLNTILFSIFLLGALYLTSSCKKGNGGLSNIDVTSQINDFPKETLNADELSSLQLMREEEKLARDVYTVLYEKWKVNVFTNISSSEQKHTDAVLTLINKYGLTDPVASNAVVYSQTQNCRVYTPNWLPQAAPQFLMLTRLGPLLRIWIFMI